LRVIPGREVVDRLGDFYVLGCGIRDLEVTDSSEGLFKYIRALEEDLRSSVQLDDIKEDAVFKAYRRFFWRSGIDPTKTRPASEALTRRILNGKHLPSINSFVDALNAASVQTKIPFAAFDASLLEGSLTMRFARAGESMLPIGHAKPLRLDGREVVISDNSKVVALYPHRDSDETKISEETKRAVVLSCGVPGIDAAMLWDSLKTCADLVVNFCGGSVTDM